MNLKPRADGAAIGARGLLVPRRRKIESRKSLPPRDLVDAETACPVKEEIFRVATRFG